MLQIVNSGFEVDLSDSQVTLASSDWNDSIIANARKEELSAMSPAHSDSKKRRIDSATRREFESALLDLYKWLDCADLEISGSEGACEMLTVDEKMSLYNEKMDEMTSKKADYDNVMTLGKRLIEELKQVNESSDEDEAKIKNIETCWLTTEARLKAIKAIVDVMLIVKECRAEITSLKLMLEGHSKWFESNQGSTQIELFRVNITIFSVA